MLHIAPPSRNKSTNLLPIRHLDLQLSVSECTKEDINGMAGGDGVQCQACFSNSQ
jgi:hypothetical protein